jgi:hypothetical protein
MVFILSKGLRPIYMYMLFKRRPGNLAILHKPQLLLRIPPAARCFRLKPRRHIRGCNAQGNKGFRGVLLRVRRPVRPFDNQLDRLQALSQFFIVPESNAEQGAAVFFHQALGPMLPRFEDQPCFHSTLYLQIIIVHNFPQDGNYILFSHKATKPRRREVLFNFYLKAKD